jgi:hypothetical protein
VALRHTGVSNVEDRLTLWSTYYELGVRILGGARGDQRDLPSRGFVDLDEYFSTTEFKQSELDGSSISQKRIKARARRAFLCLLTVSQRNLAQGPP